MKFWKLMALGIALGVLLGVFPEIVEWLETP
jgi:hypothetical protein